MAIQRAAFSAEPTVTIAKGTIPPTEPKTTVLATGLGADVVKGELGIVQFSAVGWSGESLRTTWATGPEGVAIGGEQPSPFDLLVGIPVGSRVLLELPAQQVDRDLRTGDVGDEQVVHAAAEAQA